VIIVTKRDYVKIQIDTLPESVVERVIEFISFQKYRLGLHSNDTEYLSSIPGMVESIKAAASEPLSEGTPASEINFNV